MRRALVTGGSGFIGSHLIKLLLGKNWAVFNLDKLTYASTPSALEILKDDSKYFFLEDDICNRNSLKEVFFLFEPDIVFHLAAESHVDRSITNPEFFIQTNIIGTYRLLDEALNWWKKKNKPGSFRFIHISTDEVYGSLLPGEALFTEKHPYAPSSPYSASKAAADMLVLSWYKTYGLPTIITHSTNNYGEYQNIEKLIPTVIHSSLSRKKIPVYGKGENMRDWLYVEDHARALELISLRGEPGEVYNVPGYNELTNLELIIYICEKLDKLEPLCNGKSYKDQISFVKDRPGHDFRYAMDKTKIESLGWQAQTPFSEGILKTIKWALLKNSF